MKYSLIQLTKQKSKEDDSQWLPISDLMSGLMIMFLFIAISLIANTKKVADNYQDTQNEIFQALNTEFKDNLEEWKAKIDKESLTFIFTDPEVLFKTGEATLQNRFKLTLDEFFPRYMAVIDKYKEDISEVRIEGHTSSEWSKESTEDTAYFENMRLSQERTRSVLEYTYHLDSILKYRDWIKKHISAVGLSSSQIIKFDDGNENKAASKRVTFKIVTNAEEQLRKLSEIK